MGYFDDLKRIKRAAEGKAKHIHYDWPALGPHGHKYYVHTFWVGPLNAANVGVIISGTHGSEGPGGAYLQWQLLRARNLKKKLGGDTAILLVFGIDVEAYMLGRRTGLTRVDSNRGNGPEFTTREHTPEVRTGEAYKHYCRYRMPFPLTRADFAELLELNHNQEFGRFMMAGQHDDEKGFGWGGKSISRAGQVAIEICARQLGRAKRVTVLDLHMGLYPDGALLSTAETEVQAAHIRKWLGDGVEFINLAATRSTRMQGTMIQLFERQLEGKEVLVAAMEMQGALEEPLAHMIAENCICYCGEDMDVGLVEQILQEYSTAFWLPGDDFWLMRLCGFYFGAIEKMLRFLHS